MPRFSQSVSALRSSAIRELMSLASRPDIISFAGGMPGNDLFPVKEVEELFRNLDPKTKQAAFQYGPTPGLPSLLESLSGYLERKGLPVQKNRLMITTGSQQALSILARAFIDPGERVLSEYPCFIGAIAAFKACGADIVSIPVDEEGIDIGLLQQEAERPSPAKLLYLTPYFHNPAGMLYTTHRKHQLIEIMQGRDIPIIEDDAYGDLWFCEEDRERLQPLKSIDPEGIDLCYTGSFSKILGPGLRLGWLLAPEAIHEKCELIKQSADACSPSFTQVIADAFIRSGRIDSYIASVRNEYQRRAASMTAALRSRLPDYVQWNEPKGGFYIWLTLPEGSDATEILKHAIDGGAVFVAGSTFDPEGRRNNAIRLSYCNNTPEEIERGIPVVARAIRDVCGEG
ncbi:MAG: PLP-dependent aminotransferase family protein [Chlorobium sp.]|uniref:aminotransferase-like domain-containing protein n=1 Tax=Chlorobium sp. TaxID=1095 RepID=UPI0025C3D713|nr:PLP-dependent aminotransferase family protein [Chlorobium sp.]MCF8216368.1 PLP-dependent aminotransferase family protein [Chlorobium sp.]MCF8271271.1 PLP-dependent aminotransferase family protein [Chlorobium sp.]MCF8287645.1 PLP-dependent aminotransferase family protein [Chlorobium sp.]MCF8291184.1 PLP-dependent aminotransferase family protein [Chlorobium sp.]MCF8385279.1 PLP-dependent aminotransferase family protein [Chlorobium sp.]